MPDKDELDAQEQGYAKVDKRVTKEAQDAQPAGADDAAGQAAQAPPEEPADRAAAESAQSETTSEAPADVGVYGILRFCVGLVAQQAWIGLGIVAPPGGETKENLPEARVAIDTLALLVDKLKPDLDEVERREMDVTLADLRANYVRRAG